MAGFVQVIEFSTSRIEEVETFHQQWRGDHPGMGPRRTTITQDRDRPGTYASIVEFDSHEEALRNSQDPATAEFAEKMASFCDGPPVFRNLDVRLQEVRSDAGRRAAAGA